MTWKRVRNVMSIPNDRETWERTAAALSGGVTIENSLKKWLAAHGMSGKI